MTEYLESASGARTENDAVIEVARLSTEVEKLTTSAGGELAVFRTVDGIEIVDLDDDEYSDRAKRPRRKDGATTVRDVASFARLRYRIHSSKLLMIYVMDRPEDVVRDAVKTVVAKVEEACGIKVMRGTPS